MIAALQFNHTVAASFVVGLVDVGDVGDGTGHSLSDGIAWRAIPEHRGMSVKGISPFRIRPKGIKIN